MPHDAGKAVAKGEDVAADLTMLESDRVPAQLDFDVRPIVDKSLVIALGDALHVAADVVVVVMKIISYVYFHTNLFPHSLSHSILVIVNSSVICLRLSDGANPQAIDLFLPL